MQLAGQVEKAGESNEKILFTLSDKTKQYLCEAETFQFIETGDIVAFEAKETTTRERGKYANRKIYIIPKNAIITFPDSDYDVLVACKAAYNGVQYKAQNSYDEIDEEATKCGMGIAEYLYEFSEEMPSDNRIYIWWITHRINRRLWHLGFESYKEIEAGKEFYRCSAAKLYDLIVKNPLHIVALTLEKALKLCKRLAILYDKRDLRITHIARYIYSLTEQKSYTCVKKARVKKNYPKVKQYLKELERDYDIVISRGCYYFRYHLQVENEMAKNIKQLLNYPDRQIHINKTPDCTLDETQMSAVTMALTKHISLIKGGPGRGKTKIIKELIEQLKSNGISYAISGYMGKTVSRAREITGDKDHSFTLHMMLKKRNIPKIEHLIIDEISMVYTALLYEVMKKYPSIKYITLIGDNMQLQPLRWGYFMRQVLKTELVPTVTLRKNYRSEGAILEFDEKDNIIENKHCSLIRGSLTSVISAYEKLLRKGANVRDIQVVTPKNDTVDDINKSCQVLSSEGKKYLYDGQGRKFMVGDKVILKVNNYDIDQYNGDMGLIIDIDTKKRIAVVEFEDKTEDFVISKNKWGGKYNSFTPGKRELTTDMLQHAYCITVHSAQGSEWLYVIFFVPKGNKHVSFFNFYMINTATSRTILKLQIIGDIRAVQAYVKEIPNEPCDNLAQALTLSSP